MKYKGYNLGFHILHLKIEIIKMNYEIIKIKSDGWYFRVLNEKKSNGDKE